MIPDDPGIQRVREARRQSIQLMDKIAISSHAERHTNSRGSSRA